MYVSKCPRPDAHLEAAYMDLIRPVGEPLPGGAVVEEPIGTQVAYLEGHGLHHGVRQDLVAARAAAGLPEVLLPVGGQRRLPAPPSRRPAVAASGGRGRDRGRDSTSCSF
jgi:hypothetical protein